MEPFTRNVQQPCKQMRDLALDEVWRIFVLLKRLTKLTRSLQIAFHASMCVKITSPHSESPGMVRAQESTSATQHTSRFSPSWWAKQGFVPSLFLRSTEFMLVPR
jgi:hypothetical protein